MDNQTSVHRAYERIKEDYTGRLNSMEQSLDSLLEISREVESELLRKMKPTIVLSLKWKFDFLSKVLGSPFELEYDLEYWIRVVKMLIVLGEKGWFGITEGQCDDQDPWLRTAEGFDLGWTTTTDGDQFEISRQIAKERLDQILEVLGGPEHISRKEILDSGCGPGRYVDLMRNLGPKRIVGLEQGERLIKVLRERFKDDPRVAIVKGTCEKLEFDDGSFDLVFSNGVLHHTPSDIRSMLEDHARVLRKDGAMFIMLVGKGGMELKLWEFIRNFLYDVPLEDIIENFRGCISPLRLQGVVDHMYGEYQQTSREEFEGWCSKMFSRIERVPGVTGLDVTPEVYKDDPYFDPRFGCGQLRYLCFK